ncbi:MAG TPA: hypothetical protein VGC32_10870 [Solirubrobacterales bacterium]
MKGKLHLGRRAAILVCAASLAGTAFVLAPAAPAAAATKCGDKTIKVPEAGGKPLLYPVKAVEVSGGAVCGEVASVLTSVISGHPKPGWKGVTAHYELPKALQDEGFLAMEVKKGSKTIKYGGHGG